METAATSMALRIWLASLPPPMASKAMVAPVAVTAAISSAMKFGEVESTTYLAPRSVRILA